MQRKSEVGQQMVWVVGLIALASACAAQPQGQPPVQAEKKGVAVRGKLTEVDTAGKTIKVEGRKGSQAFVIDKKTRFAKTESASLADIKSGQRIRVNGKISDDQTSVDAKRIIILPEGQKLSRGKGITKATVLGTADVAGDKITVQTADGKKVSVATSANTSVIRALNAAFEDLKVGLSVAVKGKKSGDTVVAQIVDIIPPKTRGIKRGKIQ